MTQAACSLILHLSTLHLTWRSVKSLKLPPHMMDAEILISWSLIAFHGVLLPLENILSYLPLYYYAKMILLVATFMPNTRLPRVWFDLVLVPSIERLHRLLDVGACGWLLYQAKLLPWRLVDLVLLPGILTEGDDMRRRRSVELKEARLRLPFLSDSNDTRMEGAINCRDKRGAEKDKSESTTKMEEPDGFGRLANDCTQEESPISSPNMRSRMVASSLHLRKFSREHESERMQPVRSSPRADSSHETFAKIATSDPDKRFTAKSVRSPLTPILPRTSPRFPRSIGASKSDPLSPTETKNGQRVCFDSDSPIAVGKRARRSLRAFVTGDASIRVRDFMFDLDMPALPTPRFAAGNSTVTSPRGCSTVTKNVRLSVGRDDHVARKARNKERSRRRRTTGTVLHLHKTEAETLVESGRKSGKKTFHSQNKNHHREDGIDTGNPRRSGRLAKRTTRKEKM